MPDTDPLPKLVKDYDDATLLERLATSPRDKRRFNIMRNILFCAIVAYVGQVTWH